MSFAVGVKSQAICDRCGYQYPYLELKKEWNGLLVCPECYEPKHPQLEPPYSTPDRDLSVSSDTKQIFTRHTNSILCQKKFI